MGRSKIPAIAFLVSGVFMLACCFLPLMRVTTSNSLFMEDEVIKFMPTVGGFIVMIMALLCILVPLFGLKNKAAIAGTVTAITAVGILWRLNSGAKASAAVAGQYTEALGSAFGSTTQAAPVEVITQFGFYLTIIAAICVLVTGFLYTLTED